MTRQKNWRKIEHMRRKSARRARQPRVCQGCHLPQPAESFLYQSRTRRARHLGSENRSGWTYYIYRSRLCRTCRGGFLFSLGPTFQRLPQSSHTPVTLTLMGYGAKR